MRCPPSMEKELTDDLTSLEETLLFESSRLKWGVLYCKADQKDEDAMYGNGKPISTIETHT